MSEARDLNVGHRSFSEPPTPRVRLTHRHIHFLKRPSELALRATVVVGFTHRNHPEGLRGALHSALQQVINQQIALLVLDDSSDEGWIHSLDAPLLSDPRIAIAVARLGSPAQARNGVLDLVELAYPCARWVARMDADDRFATPGSLQALVQAGDAGDCHFVVGSNRLSVGGVELADVNCASPSILLNRRSLNVFIQAFCRQQVPQELPSCNLLLRVGSGIRYPYAVSAEDHWLVAGLLMHRSQDGCVVTDPPYAVYSLGGEMTRVNQKGESWTRSRLALAQAADTWCRVHEIPGATVLGWGQEGVVWRESKGIYKRFYPYAMSAGDLLQVKRLTDAAGDAVIAFEPCEDGGEGLLIKLDSEPLLSLGRRWPLALSHRLLLKLYRSGVITSNMKRDNLRLTRGGELQYIDIGRDIVPLTASRFLDCAARLYAIGELGWSDHEMARRKTVERQTDALEVLSGFSAFYGALIRSLHPGCELELHERSSQPKPPDHEDVTLLIKCCPQDAKSVDAQVRHLVSELRIRARFGKTILLADPFEGPYLRQYDKGSLSLLRSAVDRLQAAGWVDEVWWAKTDPDVIADINRRWFSEADVMASHTVQGAPLFSQLWAFDRVETPYVLQMDVDVLIGGTDSRHDVIADMKRACMASDVWCVGFNIPQTSTGFKPYAGEPDSYAPEVRCGLLHLERVRSRTPFVNPLDGERLTWMWHQALRHAQPLMGMRSVRGGDSRTFYVHPKNEDKETELIERVRDLIGQGWIPGAQQGAWDLDASASWSYPKRGEEVVFLLFGRETPPVKLERCLSSLRAQSDQQFGVVIIDDAGDTYLSVELPHRLAWLRERVTLIRRSTRVGYMTNFREAVERVCTNPDTLLVVLDQDDALMHTNVVQQLKAACMGGADLINAPMFRPEKPTTLYEVSHELPRQRGGGNVWSHLRAFRKGLFEQVPEQVWSIAPDPDCLSDFLTMVPMTELAKHPLFLDGPYAYWHERLPYSDDRKAREATMKAWLFSQPSLAQPSQG